MASNASSSETEPSKYSIVTAFIIFTYSVWVLCFTVSINVCNKVQNCLLRGDAFTKMVFMEWIEPKTTDVSTAGKDNKGKSTAAETVKLQITNASTSNSSTPNKRGTSWQMDPQSNKRQATKVATIVPLPASAIREVFVVFRAFYHHNELMGFGVWNSYIWKNQIDLQFGFPANAYLRMEDIGVPHATLPPIVEQLEANAYFQNNNPTEHNRISLAHLLLFSIAERSQFHFGAQLPGFHYITKRGLDQVPLHKWLDGDNGNFEELSDQELTTELNTSNMGCQTFLLTQTTATHNPATPGLFMNNPARYTLIRQRRNIQDGAMDLFDRLLNYARGNVSRHVIIPDNALPVEVAGGPV